MIIKILTILGLAIIPFFRWFGYDTRQPKMALAVAFALALGLFGLYQGKLKAFSNKWLFIFLGYLLINYQLAPTPEITLFGSNVGMFWAWKPIFVIFVFSLMLITIASLDYSEQDKRWLFTAMIWCGFLMSLYVIAQYFFFDQFYDTRSSFNPNTVDWNSADTNRIGGTLGNPTIAGPFIAMIIPIALLMKWRIKAVVMGVAVFMTHGQIAIGALILALIFLVAVKSRRHFIYSGITVLILINFLVLGYFEGGKVKDFTKDNERFKTWNEAITDIRTPLSKDSPKRYPFTGLGMGTFNYVFHVKHNNIFMQAHNDYVELLYNTGIIGLSLFLCGIGYMLKKNFSFNDVFSGKADRYRMHLLSSFICIAICAGGIFCWQLGPHIYYSIIIAGLLHNQTGGMT